MKQIFIVELDINDENVAITAWAIKNAIITNTVSIKPNMVMVR